MRKLSRLVLGGAVLTGFAIWAAPVTAWAATISHAGVTTPGGERAVFVQTDNLSGNQVVAYRRGGDGRLSAVHTYATYGLGGKLNGAVVDDLASQGSLAYDPQNDMLFAVNAGSNTVSVFAVSGDRLAIRQVLYSGGDFPVSVAAYGDLIYVLNAEHGGSLAGYRVVDGVASAVPGSIRQLRLPIPSDSTQFTHTPGQVAFSQDGTRLIVTTKASTNSIDVFRVLADGRIGRVVVNPEAGTVPFAVTFDQAGHLLVADAGTNALATYFLNLNGTLTPIDSVGTGQQATCWVAAARGYFFTSNAGSASLSRYKEDTDGGLTLLGAATTDPGTVDAAASANGDFLYVQTGANGIVDEFRVTPTGTLVEVGSVTVSGAAGGEGIVAF